MRLEFLGAAHTVTGSCFLLETNNKKILIDCGLFQGARRVRDLNREDFRFNPADIECVLLTHAHVDHCGLIPRLYKFGYKGEVYATKTTTELAAIMLPDSAHIQEADTITQNRKGERRGESPLQPLYTIEDAAEALQHFKVVPYDENIYVTDNVTVIYRDAGHIIGSAFIEVYVSEEEKTTKLVFSGDLGQPGQPIIKDPTIITGSDYLIMESTYGDRLHQIYDKEEVLAEIINDTMDRGGNLIIPTFAVGRTQTILYYLYRLWKSGRIDEVPIILDSPLAIAATRIFAKNSQDFDEESLELFVKNHDRLPQMPMLRICETPEESRELNSSESSAIILSASGMADAGRVLHHLKHNLWRAESTVLFVGYQAEGSLGRRLLEGMKRVRVLGEEVAVKARIERMDGFSAHADANQMIDWACHLQEPKPAKVFLVHGEGQAATALQKRLKKELGLEVYIPFRGDEAKIDGRECTIVESNIPAVSVEAEMEDYLKNMDSAYRDLRHKLMRIVVKNPESMENVIKLFNRGWKYMKKVFSSYDV